MSLWLQGLRTIVVVAVGVGMLAACGADRQDEGDAQRDEKGGAGPSGNSSGAAGSPAPRSTCDQTCGARASACGAPASQGSMVCEGICAKGPSQVQLDCFSAAPCSELSTLNEGGSLCGLGEPAPGGNTQPGAGTTTPTPTKPTYTKPTDVTITGSFGKLADPFALLSEDRKELITFMSLEARPIKLTPTVDDTPDVRKAASKKVLRPAATTCKTPVELSVSTTSNNVLFTFTGTDVLPSTACLDFEKEIIRSGLKVEYTDVPYLNGGKASRVVVDIVP